MGGNPRQGDRYIELMINMIGKVERLILLLR